MNAEREEIETLPAFIIHWHSAVNILLWRTSLRGVHGVPVSAQSCCLGFCAALTHMRLSQVKGDATQHQTCAHVLWEGHVWKVNIPKG